MGTSNSNIIRAFAVFALVGAAGAQPAADSVESHLLAGKNAAGGRDNTPDFYGLVTALCVAPLNAPPRLGARPRNLPSRDFSLAF